jgi:hypothetical protein
MIPSVDPQPIITIISLTGDAPSVKLEFVLEYVVAFGDERVEDSTDNHLFSELSNRDKVLLQ